MRTSLDHHIDPFRRWLPAIATALLIVALAAPAAGQTSTGPSGDPNPGNLTLTMSFDAVSTYMFRGIRQNSTGIALWPVADLGLAVYSGNGGPRPGDAEA